MIGPEGGVFLGPGVRPWRGRDVPETREGGAPAGLMRTSARAQDPVSVLGRRPGSRR